MSLLAASGLVVSYGGRAIFSGVDLELGPGLHALTGANGSGKSTLLRLLAGAQRPDAGRCAIAGHDLWREPQAARAALAYVPSETPAYPFMTPAELFRFTAAAKKVPLEPAVDAFAAALGLEPYLDQRFDALSLGTQKKAMLVTAAIGAPRVLLLDEPSNGLDESALGHLAAWLVQAATNTAVLFATHDSDFIAATRARILRFDALARTAA